MPLQHQHAAVLTGKRQSSGLTIRANGLPLPQPEKFPIVRGQDRQTATPGVQNIYMFCHRVYTIGIQNQRGLKPLHQMTGAHIRLSASAQARSNENPVALVHIFQKNLKSRHRSRHSLLAFHCQHGPDLWRNRQRYQTRACANCGGGGERSRAGQPHAACQNMHLSKGSLVSVPFPHGQAVMDKFSCYLDHGGALPDQKSFFMQFCPLL